MDTFVNPVPGISVSKWLGFDFPLATNPSEYRTPGCRRNMSLGGLEKPAHEAIYGKFGNPGRLQGFPCIGEVFPEQEDPSGHDQIIDIDRPAFIDHTGRLSGSFVKPFAHIPGYVSIVKMYAIGLTNGDGAPKLIWQSGPVSLAPSPVKVANRWYWENPSLEQELIFTAHCVLNPGDWRQLNLNPGIYNLVINWEFWDRSDPNNAKRLPIAGFDEAISFELSAATTRL